MKKKNTTQTRRPEPTFRRLLVPVDFSDSSAHALRHAADLAAKSGGSLVIVHVVPANYGWSGIGRDEWRDLDRSLQRQAADRLRAFADEHAGHRVAADLEVRIGQPAEEVIAAAQESNCHLIVLSTRGLTGLDRYLIGSVADRVARLASCPVLLLPPGKGLPVRKPLRPAILRLKHKTKRDRK